MKRKTNYPVGSIMRLVDNDFNNWEIGVDVKVVWNDDYQYHVKNLKTEDHVWVHEKQIAPIK